MMHKNVFPGDGEVVGVEDKQMKDALAYDIILPMHYIKGVQIF